MATSTSALHGVKFNMYEFTCCGLFQGFLNAKFYSQK